MNCVTSGPLHFELVAGKPGVEFAAESCLMLMVCFYSHVPVSVLCCLFFPFIPNNSNRAIQSDFISPFSRE